MMLLPQTSATPTPPTDGIVRTDPPHHINPEAVSVTCVALNPSIYIRHGTAQ